MRVTIEALEEKLAQKTLDSCYLLVSTESFLVQKTRDAIWHLAHQQGFCNRQVWEVTTHFDWVQLQQQNDLADLFDRTFIELRCMRSLDAKTGERLNQWVKRWQSIQSRLAPIIIISCEQWSKKQQSAAWFQQLVAMSTFVIMENSMDHLPRWVHRQLMRVGLKLTQEATSVLMQSVEGNLAAAYQTIENLSLIYGDVKTPIDIEQLRLALTDQSVFEISQLTDAILKNEKSRCLRILNYLQINSISPALVLGYLSRVLRTIASLRDGLDRGQALPHLFQKYAVWQKQQVGFKQAVQSIQAQDIPLLFHVAHQADRCIKGADSAQSWHYLTQLSLYLLGNRFLLTFKL